MSAVRGLSKLPSRKTSFRSLPQIPQTRSHNSPVVGRELRFRNFFQGQGAWCRQIGARRDDAQEIGEREARQTIVKYDSFHIITLSICIPLSVSNASLN